MFAKQVAAMKRAEIKSSVLNSASVITFKKNQLPLLSNASLYIVALLAYPAAGGCHVFAHGTKLEYIRSNFVKVIPRHAPPAGHMQYHVAAVSHLN